MDNESLLMIQIVIQIVIHNLFFFTNIQYNKELKLVNTVIVG